MKETKSYAQGWSRHLGWRKMHYVQSKDTCQTIYVQKIVCTLAVQARCIWINNPSHLRISTYRCTRAHELMYPAIPSRSAQHVINDGQPNSTCCQQWPSISLERRPHHQPCDRRSISPECIVAKLQRAEKPRRNAPRLFRHLLLLQASSISHFDFSLHWHNGGSRDVTLCDYSSWNFKLYPFTKEGKRNRFLFYWGP